MVVGIKERSRLTTHCHYDFLDLASLFHKNGINMRFLGVALSKSIELGGSNEVQKKVRFKNLGYFNCCSNTHLLTLNAFV